MKIELIDLKQRYLDEKDELIKCVEKVLRNGTFVLVIAFSGEGGTDGWSVGIAVEMSCSLGL